MGDIGEKKKKKSLALLPRYYTFLPWGISFYIISHIYVAHLNWTDTFTVHNQWFLQSDVFDSYFSFVWTDLCERPSCTCTTSSGSRRDCTEAFLSTTSAASRPRLWPSPPTSSWSKSCTWTDCHSHSSRSLAIVWSPNSRINFFIFFLFFLIVLKQGRNLPTFAQLNAAEDRLKWNWVDDRMPTRLSCFNFLLHFPRFATSERGGVGCWEHVVPIWLRLWFINRRVATKADLGWWTNVFLISL